MTSALPCVPLPGTLSTRSVFACIRGATACGAPERGPAGGSDGAAVPDIGGVWLRCADAKTTLVDSKIWSALLDSKPSRKS